MISICIPAYSRINYLTRLLKSIEQQTFRDFEVIISDDSIDNSVSDLIKNYEAKFKIQYFKNEQALGTPSNWNFAISKSNGDWIKIMHDDDWFTSSESLSEFSKATKYEKKMIFSAYSNYFEDSKQYQNINSSAFQRNNIVKQPFLLLANNIIGPPSVTMIHKSILEKYDERLKWRVDLEFYIRIILKERTFYYIPSNLIAVGISASQVTNYCINIPEVEIPESYILLSKYGTKSLKNIIIYDAWWRIIRNCSIRSKEDLHKYVNAQWPDTIEKIASFQGKIKQSILKIGYLSKILMLIAYLQNIIQGKK